MQVICFGQKIHCISMMVTFLNITACSEAEQIHDWASGQSVPKVKELGAGRPQVYSAHHSPCDPPGAGHNNCCTWLLKLKRSLKIFKEISTVDLAWDPPQLKILSGPSENTMRLLMEKNEKDKKPVSLTIQGWPARLAWLRNLPSILRARSRTRDNVSVILNPDYMQNLYHDENVCPLIEQSASDTILDSERSGRSVSDYMWFTITFPFSEMQFHNVTKALSHIWKHISAPRTVRFFVGRWKLKRLRDAWWMKKM